MKRYLTVFVLLCIISTAHGAHFNYYAGGFRAFFEAYARDYYFFDGPWSNTMEGTGFASVSGAASVPEAESYASNYMRSDISNNSISIRSYSIAEGRAWYSYCFTRGLGFGSTQNSSTDGIYYQIMPDVNEQVGDDVVVYYNDIVSITAEQMTYLYIGGTGTLDHISITRNQFPPVTTEPDRENEVLRFPNVEVSNSGNTEWFSGVHAFPAKIGDVIGIFALNYTKVEGSGTLQGSIYSTLTMILTVKPVLLGDSDYDNDVDFFDLARLAYNWLKGVDSEPPVDTTPPEPNPMKWALGGEPKEIGSPPFDFYATMTAHTATDPSGGIQYEFVCTTNSGFSSGWQGSPSYNVLVGGSGQGQTFKVRARDLPGNMTGWSSAVPALP